MTNCNTLPDENVIENGFILPISAHAVPAILPRLNGGKPGNGLMEKGNIGVVRIRKGGNDLRLDHYDARKKISARMAPNKKTVSVKVPYYGLTKFLVLKLALPHVCLWSLATLYCVGGALVFMQLEGRDSQQATQLLARSINQTAKTIVLQLYNLTNAYDLDEASWKAMSNEKMNDFIGQIYEMRKRMDTSIWDRGKEKWAFGRACFFTATTLTSIGYGNQTPSTRSGKIFCIFYALFGLPLVVITVTDIAKFISHFIVWLYIRYMMVKWLVRTRFRAWQLKRRQRRESLRLQRRCGISAQEADALTAPRGNSDEEVAEFLWVNLVNAEFVEIPVTLMFALILGYVTLGGHYFRCVEEWSFFEGFYFSLISILAVGFGDYTPTNDRYIYLSLLYVLFGIILTTTCIDIVGIDYLNKLHFWGRKLNKVDPLQWLKDVQERRLRNMKKKAMVALFNTLTALHYMRLDPALLGNMRTLLLEDRVGDEGLHDTLIESPLNKQEQTTSQNAQDAVTIVTNSPFKTEHGRMPPSVPSNLRAVHISVHSVTLKWDQPVSGLTEDMYYSLSYRLRTMGERNVRRQALPHRQSAVQGIVASSLTHGFIAYPECFEIADAFDESPSSALHEFRSRLAPRRMGMTGIERIPASSTSFTVYGLKSFAFYQFSLAAVNKNGRSRPVRTQEYTEPSTVPLNIRTTTVSDTMAKVVWDPPARNKLGPRRYTLHVTSDSNKPFNEWVRIEASAGEQEHDLLDLEPMTSYVICVSANHNRGLATLSRSLTFATSATPADENDSDIREAP